MPAKQIKLNYHQKRAIAQTLINEGWEQLRLMYGQKVKIRYSGTDNDGHYLWIVKDKNWNFVYISPTGFVAHIKRPQIGHKYCRAVGCCEDITPKQKKNKHIRMQAAA